MSARTTYDEVRYSNYPYAQTHPDRLATVAALHGLSTPDPATARVLEIGCGAGGNLMAMATASPGISALGVDLAAGPIAEGQEAIAAVGIENVELRQGDISSLRDGQLGDFDFVVAHGVYAWIPEPVRDDLLAMVHSHLAPDGLGYISYNANPGGYMRRALADAGRWYAGETSDVREQAERAQQLFRFVWENRAGTKDWWGSLLESQLPAFAEAPLYKLVHDDLGEHMSSVWFGDFAAHAAANGLAYVGDADLTNLLPGRLPAAVATDAEAFSKGDRIAHEQLIDILRCVFFRQSVLCRDSRTASDHAVVDALRTLHYGTLPNDSGEEQPGGLLGSALALLRSRAPDTLSFSELRAATGAEPDELDEALRDGFLGELLMPHRTSLQAIRVADVERPVASPLARWQARDRDDITSMAYTTVHMEEPAARLLLRLLDGTRDRAAIRADFSEESGVALTPEVLDANLEALARLFLLTDR